MARMIKTVSKYLFRNRLRVLFYHRVNDYSYRLAIKPGSFESQIKYLTKEYNIISQEEYINILENGTGVKNGLLITFDDGYKDNYIHAYPILKKYSVPATIFLSTDFIDGKIWMWLDMVRYIIKKTRSKSKIISLGEWQYNLNVKDKTGQLNARMALYSYLRNIPYNRRIEQIKNLALILEVELPERPTKEYAPLSWDEIREMAQNRIEFGAHTCGHEILSKIKEEDAHHEITESKKRIENKLQIAVDSFAYPNGQAEDFTKSTSMLLKKAGYRIAFTTINGMNNKLTDRFQNKRISGIAKSQDYFYANVSGLNIIKHSIRNAVNVG